MHNNFYKTFVHKYCTESKIVEKILHLGWTWWIGVGDVQMASDWLIILKGFVQYTHIGIHKASNKHPFGSFVRESCDPKSLAVDKAPCPSRASTLSLGPGLVGDGHWWSAHVCLTYEDARTMSISAYFDEAFCAANICPLASGQGPNPFHKKHQTAVRWSWLWATTKWTHVLLPLGEGASSYRLSPETPHLQAPAC